MAWQAIQDANGALVGHEIFNRSRTASAHTMDSDLALAHAVLSHLEPAQLLGNGLLFLNTTFESLHGPHLELLPANQVVLEIPSLGHAASSEAQARRPALQALRAKGFALAFNHSVLDSAYAPWHDLVNYLKIDFSVLTADRAILMIRWARRLAGATVVADKIESPTQLQLAQENNVDLLQGYAVSRPEPILARVVLPTTAEVTALAKALRHEASTADISQLLQHSPCLMFNLLRMARLQSLDGQAAYTTVDEVVDAYSRERLAAWATLLQSVAVKAPAVSSTPECQQQFPQRSAQLLTDAQARWPDVPAPSLQLMAHALLLGTQLGMDVAPAAQQLLPPTLAVPAEALAPQWLQLLQGL